MAASVTKSMRSRAPSSQRTSVLLLVHEVHCAALQHSTPILVVGPEPALYSIRGPCPGGRFWPDLAACGEFALGCQLQKGRFWPLEAVIDICNLALEHGGYWRTRPHVSGAGSRLRVPFVFQTAPKSSIQVPNVFRSRSARETSSATKRNIMEQNGTHFSVNQDFTRRAQAAWSRTGSPSAVYKTRRSGSGRPGPHRRFAPPGVARMSHSLKLVEALLSVARNFRLVRPPEPQFEEPVCELFAFRH